jgi:hypothetical protein
VKTIPCPVEDCNGTIASSFKALARDAACIKAYLPVFEREILYWLDQPVPEEFSSFVRMGEGLFKALHDFVHHPQSGFPPLEEIVRWRRTATESFHAVAQVDPAWFVEYWRGAKAKGIKLQPSLKSLLRGAERRLPRTA